MLVENASMQSLVFRALSQSLVWTSRLSEPNFHLSGDVSLQLKRPFYKNLLKNLSPPFAEAKCPPPIDRINKNRSQLCLKIVRNS